MKTLNFQKFDKHMTCSFARLARSAFFPVGISEGVRYTKTTSNHSIAKNYVRMAVDADKKMFYWRRSFDNCGRPWETCYVRNIFSVSKWGEEKKMFHFRREGIEERPGGTKLYSIHICTHAAIGHKQAQQPIHLFHNPLIIEEPE